MGLPRDQVSGRRTAPAWTITFADLMSLLLCFFVLLLSFSQMDVAKFKEVAGSLERAFGVQRKEVVYDPPKGTSVVFKDQMGEQAFGAIIAKLQESMNRARKGAGKDRSEVRVELFEDYRGIVMRIDEGDMFPPGSADLRPSVWPFIEDVVAAVQDERVDLAVEAHTDDVPIKSARFQDNWNLSAARAVSVVRYVEVGGRIAPTRLAAVGKGDSTPLVPNVSAKNRARNRRVEIVFSRRARPKTWSPGSGASGP